MGMRINGKPTAVGQNISVEQLVREKGLIPERVVVEINRQIVPREQWPVFLLKEGDDVEIVSFVAGG